MLLAASGQPEGIPDGRVIYARGNRIKSGGEGPIVKATLQNLIFADGQFVTILVRCLEHIGDNRFT